MARGERNLVDLLRAMENLCYEMFELKMYVT